jgi:hypothetical protein
MFNQFNGVGSEIWVELKHRLQELDGLAWGRLESLCQTGSFQLTLNLVGVDECALVSQVCQVLIALLAKDFEHLDELIIFTDLGWSSLCG